MTDYKPGDVANGYQWTGTQWVLLPSAPYRQPMPATPLMSSKEQRNIVLVAAGVGMALLVVLALVMAALGALNPSTADYADEVWRACKDQVTAQLKAPATADFPWQVDAIITHAGDKYTVRSYVDAENGFGANIRTSFVCTATVTGGKVTATAALS